MRTLNSVALSSLLEIGHLSRFVTSRLFPMTNGDLCTVLGRIWGSNGARSVLPSGYNSSPSESRTRGGGLPRGKR